MGTVAYVAGTGVGENRIIEPTSGRLVWCL
jgi:hypothetical protein